MGWYQTDGSGKPGLSSFLFRPLSARYVGRYRVDGTKCIAHAGIPSHDAFSGKEEKSGRGRKTKGTARR